MLYQFKDIEALKDYVNDNLISGVDTVSEVDIDKDRIYIEVGAGTEILVITINQETGIIQMKLSKPNNKNNEWYWITENKYVKDELQAFVVNQSGGKSRKTRKSRKSRKSRKNRKSRKSRKN